MEAREGFAAEPTALFCDKKGRPQPWPRPLAPLADTHGHLTLFWGYDPAMAVARSAVAGVRLLVVPLDPLGDCEPARDATTATRTVCELLALLEDILDRARGLMPRLAAAGHVVPAFPSHRLLAGATPDFPLALRLVAGVHPYNAAYFDDACRARLSELLASPRCVGVGEIGLDYTCEVPRAAQLTCFREQLAVAVARNLPAELHIRDAHGDATGAAHADALALLREVGVPPRGCELHCYTADTAMMLPFTELGCHVAFGGAVTFKKSDDIRAAAVACPEHLLLCETDCPYLAPVPVRGEECEPAMVAFCAACVADVRAAADVAPRSDTYEALWSNACSLFSLS